MASRHGLLASATSASPSTGDLAACLVGLHSSDPVTVYLTVAARNDSATVDSVRNELDHLVRHHAMRRTLWVFNRSTATVAHAACTVKIARAERNKLLKALGATAAPNAPDDPQRWVVNATAAVLTELADGPLSTRQLGARLPEFRVMLEMAPGKPYSASHSALNRVLSLLGFDGEITRRGTAGGGWINSQYSWEIAGNIANDPANDTADDSAGDPANDPAEIDAQCDLARRWLDAFGPATEADLQWWMGWTVAATRRALEAVEAVEVLLDDGESGWCLPDDVEPEPDGETWTAALPGLDPTTMGWKKRDWYLEPGMVPTLFDRNGNAGPTLWVDGRVVGGWVQTADGSLDYRLLADIGRDNTESLERRLDRLSQFIGDTRFKVRFPAPLQKELYGAS